MTIQTILKYPHQALSTRCQTVERYDHNLNELAINLIDTMRAAPGVGITAAHIGILQRVFVLELTPGETKVYVNPVILTQSQETHSYTEGSVSMQGFVEEVERPAIITYTYYNLEGTQITDQADGFLSTCIQHEIDQLDGIFWLKRLSKLKRDRLIKKWGKSNKT